MFWILLHYFTMYLHSNIFTPGNALRIELTRYKVVLIEVQDLLEVVKVEGGALRPKQQPTSLLLQRLLSRLRYFVFEEEAWRCIKKTTSLGWDGSNAQSWP